MTSVGRLKRSCLCAVVAVTASAVGDLTLGLIGNQPNAANSGGGDLLVNIVGIFLAPGWLLFRGMFNRVRPNQFPGFVLLVLLFSLVADTGLIFGLWELLHRRAKRMKLSS